MSETDTATKPTRVAMSAPKAPAPAAPQPATEAVAAPAQRRLPNGGVRKPFGVQESKLAYPPRPGYARRWFNDEPGRVQRAMEAGYAHVKGPDGKRVSRSVGTAERGGGLTSFLMEIPQEFYDEDFAAKQQALDDIDRTIMRGQFDAESGDRRYGGVKMQVKRGPNARG